ncbi:MAG: NFACT family protein, partial [Oscillospiraceae bacterium]|nr:NFACT family protein [Oscillospiraceae bacterium]
MPLDSVCVSALASELRAQIVGGKIDKVQQPERDTVLLSIRSPFGNVRLALCGGVGNARVHLTDAKYENPAQPPMFCMLLRKHLVGARISALLQPERERIIIFVLDGYDEMGVPVKKQLVVEMIGRGTNIILVNGDGIIIDCLRRVDAEMSAIRQVLPGLIYRLPISQTKPDFFAATSEERRALWEAYDGQKAPDKWLLETFSCLSPLVCREIVHRCYGDTDCLPEAMDALAETVEKGEFVPYMLLSEAKPKDFSFIRINQYGADMSGESFPGFSALLDAFYTRRSQAEDLHRRTQSLRKTVKNARDRVSRKLELQRIELEKTAKREEKR